MFYDFVLYLRKGVSCICVTRTLSMEKCFLKWKTFPVHTHALKCMLLLKKYAGIWEQFKREGDSCLWTICMKMESKIIATLCAELADS